MMVSKRVFRFAWLSIVVAFVGGFVSPAARAQMFEGRELVQAELLTNTSNVVPGQSFTAGLRLRMVPGWHTYWKFPGDAGIPTEIKWNLPAGWKVGEIQWPLPLKLQEPGDILIYGYHDEVLLLQEITPPATISESLVRLKAQADWLVCERLCIPGGAALELELPVGQKANAANGEIFAKFRQLLPKMWPESKAVVRQWTRSANEISATVKIPGDRTYSFADFYPLPEEKTVVGHPQAQLHGDELQLKVPFESDAPNRLQGLLVLGQSEADSNRVGWIFSAEPAATQTTAKAPGESRSLLSFLFFGFVGGLILNLMPCVLPVISLKVFGFIQHAGSERREILRSGLAFVAGIFVWFIGVALALILLKRAGGEVGWAIQFTNPYFVLGMSVIVLVFALNLFGVFEVTLPQGANRSLLSVSAGNSHLASFFQGAFATILGTSCTAPVLGYAVGFALTQSAGVILLMFLAVAAGMGGPYLLLSAQPAWVKFLPKPGAWMERVKQLMGFPMLATLVFLLYVLGAQRGPEAIIWSCAFLVVVSLACWMKGAFITPLVSASSRLLLFLLLGLLLISSGWYFIGEKFAQTRLEAAANSGSDGWQNFTPEKLDAALQENRAVFIDFTAAWCVTCKFNEATVLESSVVREAFARRGILKFKADWTNADPTITKYLKQFGRPGVPLYVLYPGGKSEPIILPELLTKNIVLEKLETIAPQVAGK